MRIMKPLPEPMLTEIYLAIWCHLAAISRYFKSWFIIIIIIKKSGNYRNDDWVKIMWLVTRSEWTDEIPPLYLDAVSLGFHW